MSKSDDNSETRESTHEQAGNEVVESTLEAPAHAQDPTVNVTTSVYPPKPTDGKS